MVRSNSHIAKTLRPSLVKELFYSIPFFYWKLMSTFGDVTLMMFNQKLVHVCHVYWFVFQYLSFFVGMEKSFLFNFKLFGAPKFLKMLSDKNYNLLNFKNR